MSTSGAERGSVTIPPIEALHATVLQLATVLKEIVTDIWNEGYRILDPNLIDAGLDKLQGYSKLQIITNFIDYSAHCWDMVLKKDEDFFKTEAWVLFRDIPKSVVDQFYTLFTTRSDDTDPESDFLIDRDDRDILWVYFSTMIKITLHYIHEERDPWFRIIKNGNTEKNVVVYKNKSFKSEIDLNDHCVKWKIDRVFKLMPQ